MKLVNWLKSFGNRFVVAAKAFYHGATVEERLAKAENVCEQLADTVADDDHLIGGLQRSVFLLQQHNNSDTERLELVIATLLSKAGGEAVVTDDLIEALKSEAFEIGYDDIEGGVRVYIRWAVQPGECADAECCGCGANFEDDLAAA